MPQSQQPLVLAYDQDIPYLADWLPATVTKRPYYADQLQPADLRAADAIIVRSVTSVDADLLAKADSLRWLGSVTAGIDHLDPQLLQQQQIIWTNAAGANAAAVAEYMLAALAQAHQLGVVDTGAVVAVLGVGAVGSLVVQLCSRFGFKVVGYDPPRMARDPSFTCAGWEQVEQADAICVCASYHQEAPWSTHNLVSKQLLSTNSRLKALVNTARGEIVDMEALLARDLAFTCVDVWPNEPAIARRWVDGVTIATPHIAGYSQQSKWRLSQQIFLSFCEFFNLTIAPYLFLAPISDKRVAIDSLVKLASELDLQTESIRMRRYIQEASSMPAAFHHLRRSYKLRNELGLCLL